jgi:hypothetical protein
LQINLSADPGYFNPQFTAGTATLFDGLGHSQRFKRAHAPIRLLQISIPQNLLGDFCNTIGRKADSLRSL